MPFRQVGPCWSRNMSDYKNAFQFWSDSFGPLQSEEDETHDDYINDGMWARQLSDFLSEKLRELGWKVLFVAVEDWGHYISLSSTEAEEEDACVCCANAPSEIDKGALESYLVFAEPSVAEVRKWFKKLDVSGVSQKIGDDLNVILTNNTDCTDLRRDHSNNLPE